MVDNSVEGLTREISLLVRERQQLREARADTAVLEANRLELARAQQRLSHLLIERYRPRGIAA
jgi:hypothetical protein